MNYYTFESLGACFGISNWYTGFKIALDVALVSPTSWGGASLALVGHVSSDGFTIKKPYGVDVLLLQPYYIITIFSVWVG